MEDLDCLHAALTVSDTENGNGDGKVEKTFTIDECREKEWEQRLPDTELVPLQGAVSTQGRLVQPSRRAEMRHHSAQGLTHHVRLGWPLLNQRRTGLCWLYAGLTVLHAESEASLRDVNFHFSVSHLLFYDKLERASLFLQHVDNTRRLTTNSNVVSHLLCSKSLLTDAGQWSLFTNLVAKYGVVPLLCMPDTPSTTDTRHMNDELRFVLRCAAKDLRKDSEEGALRKVYSDTMALVWRILAIHLGTPVRSFEWTLPPSPPSPPALPCEPNAPPPTRERLDITPEQFLSLLTTGCPHSAHLRPRLFSCVCLVNDPRESSALHVMYSVAGLGNAIEAGGVRYFNVAIETMRSAVMRSVAAGVPVWIGCDFHAGKSKEDGLLDEHLFMSTAGQEGPSRDHMSKGERLEYGHASLTHAMVVVGFDLPSGSQACSPTQASPSPSPAVALPRYWRVQNSRGIGNGDGRGFYLMSGSWFDDNVFEASVRREFICDADALHALDAANEDGAAVHVLPPWDALASLAARGNSM